MRFNSSIHLYQRVCKSSHDFRLNSSAAQGRPTINYPSHRQGQRTKFPKIFWIGEGFLLSEKGVETMVGMGWRWFRCRGTRFGKFGGTFRERIGEFYDGSGVEATTLKSDWLFERRLCSYSRRDTSFQPSWAHLSSTCRFSEFFRS
jgi:hypothetical protein